MKQLISATLSEPAAVIYNSWERQKKSARLSEMIVKENGNMKHIQDLQELRGELRALLGAAMIHIKLKEGKTPLVERMNDKLFGTIYHQYWD